MIVTSDFTAKKTLGSLWFVCRCYVYSVKAEIVRDVVVFLCAYNEHFIFIRKLS